MGDRGRFFEGSCQAEIDQFDIVGWRDPKIVRFDIAVENAMFVRQVESLGNLGGNSQSTCRS